MKKINIYGYAFIALAVILAVINYIYLPDQVMVQVLINGNAGNTTPKMTALLIPFAISIYGALRMMFGEAKTAGKYGVISMIGHIAAFVTLISNTR